MKRNLGNTGWWITCKSDSRFDANGRAYGVFDANRQMNDYIERKIKELGIDDKDVPQDIEIQAWKISNMKVFRYTISSKSDPRFNITGRWSALSIYSAIIKIDEYNT